eukprot:2290748-Rhodomonas_salina.1
MSRTATVYGAVRCSVMIYARCYAMPGTRTVSGAVLCLVLRVWYCAMSGTEICGATAMMITVLARGATRMP